jgi:putative SOS response-associated peptidase YedK
MCGRWSLKAEPLEIEKRFDAVLPKEYKKSYNIAPTQTAPILKNDDEKNFAMAKWGLVPYWAKDEKIAYKTINAKAEPLAEKPAYKGSFKSRRCLIPADGFYEWKKTRDDKQPYRITMKDNSLFAFAGLYDVWKRSGKELLTFTIITTEPNELMKNIHIRMPAMLERKDEKAWLEENDPQALMKMLKPIASNLIKAYQISTLVNSPRNNSLEILKPIGQKTLFSGSS